MRLPFFVLPVVSLAAIGVAFSGLAAEDVLVSPDARIGLAVTIYNGDLALVRDSRKVPLPAGETRLAFTDVSTRLQPETALLQSTNDSFLVKEQVFDFDVVSRQALLNASVGKDVGIVTVNPATGEETETRATVLAVANGLVLEFNGRVTTDIPGRLVFDSLPQHLRVQPTLVVVVNASSKADVTADLSYLTGGLTWRTDYVAKLNADGTAIDLSAWATISNITGTSFPAATLKLVAGDINRTAPAPQRMRAMEMSARSASLAYDVGQESLAAFHLYTIDRPVTLADQQTKQLALLSASRIDVRTDIVSSGDSFAMRSPLNGQTRITQATSALVFNNTKAQGLGTPLPSGMVRVYGQDSAGALQLLGEDGVGHIPVGQEVRFILGRDFDVTVEREQMEFLRASDRITISEHRLTVSNAKDEAIVVRLVESMQGDWEILEENLVHNKNQGGAEWLVDVPAGGEVQVTYRVRVRF